MYIIVIGCGRLGSNLATELSNLGHNVCIIDRDGDRLNNLGSGFNGQRIKGIEFDSDNLTNGGIRQADALLAVTSDDNINITVALVAKEIYHVPKIIARVNDPNREYIYQKLNLETINPVQLGVEILINQLTARSLNIVSAQDKEFDIIELFIGKGKPGPVHGIEEKYSCIISGVIRRGHIFLPKKEEKIEYGGKISCTIPKKNEEKMIQSFSREIPIWNQ